MIICTLIRRFLISFFTLLFFVGIMVPSSVADNPSSGAEIKYQEGRRYIAGDGVQQDISKGLILVAEAASEGSPEAMIEIGKMYSAGLGKLLSKDFEDGMQAELAYEWYVKGAEAGAKEMAGYALSSDAFVYFLGSEDGSIPEDDVVALKYFQKAAEYGDPDAINMMVSFYTYGFGVEQDPDKALELGSRLADLGNAEALYSMEENAYAYYAGTKDGVDINFGTAFNYYMKLTEYGNERAMYNVGLLYEYGLGVSKDHDKAVEWLTKALDAGYSPAKEMLLQLNNNNQ